MTEVFRGACTALVTPMTERGVDYAALEKLIDFQLGGGIDALLSCGTTGEPSTLSAEEKRELISFTVKKAAGRVPVLAGTGGNDTAAVLSACRSAEKAGADALLVVTPYYNKATQNGLAAHYAAILQSTDLPVIAYNVPARTGLNMLPRTAEKLCAFKNFAGVKEASGNMDQVCELASLLAGRAPVYSGDDSLNLPVLAVGGAGAISVVSNVLPAAVHTLTRLFFEGDAAGAAALANKLYPMAKALFIEVNPIPAKAALSLMGICQNYLRMPLTPIEPQNLAALRQALEAFGPELAIA